MRMTKYDRDLEYYPVTWAPNAEGINVPTLGTAVPFRGDFQPLGRNTSRQAEYGLDSKEAKARAVYYDNDLTMAEGGIVKDALTMERFQVNGPPNVWARHSEAILVAWNG